MVYRVHRVGVGVQAGNPILNLCDDVGATPTTPPPTIKGAGPGGNGRIQCGALQITQMHGACAQRLCIGPGLNSKPSPVAIHTDSEGMK